jgi:membrane protein implicated in regulation of membrane protease activity
MKRLWWMGPQRPVPAHPYRDTALLYAALAGIVIVVAAASGYHSLVKAVIVAVAVFVAATTYSWWYWYDRIKNAKRGELDRRTRN